MTLAEQFDGLIREHRLINLSVTRSEEPGTAFWSASAQAIHNGVRLCGQHIRKTPEEALAGAIVDLNEQRSPSLIVPTLAAPQLEQAA